MIIASRDVILRRDQKLTIVPLSDIHHNAPGFDRERFLEIVCWIKRTGARKDRQVGVLLLGDYLDTFSRTERHALSNPAIHESSRSRIERMLWSDLHKLVLDLKPALPYVWGVVEGNHSYHFQDGKVSGNAVGLSVGDVLARTLNVPYFGVCGSLVLRLRPSLRAGYQQPFKIVMHHGYGTATTKAASIRQMLRLREQFPAMNLYIMAHNHVPIATVMQGLDVRLAPNGGGQYRLVSMDQAFVRSSSFLRGYLEGEAVDSRSGSYVEERCLAPQGLGVVTCNVRWKIRSDKRGKKEIAGFIIHVQE